jgi:HPt (histidine-containing phosphotransfer) domain-containing protein
MLEDREACFAAGMDDYVAKPIRQEALAGALRKAHRIQEADPDRAVDGIAELDASALDSLREIGGDEFLHDVLATFRSEAPHLLAALRRSLEAGDVDELRRAAHTLKSNGAALGAGAFATLCGELEEQVKRGRLDGANDLTGRIESGYVELDLALAALVTGEKA